MSFASSAREEIAQRSPTKECCVRAAAYGIACFAKYFDARGLVLQTEQPHTVQLAQQLTAEIARYKDAPLPAVILIPGKTGSLGIAGAALHDAVERAVGADIS